MHLKHLVVFLAILLLKPNLLRQIDNDLEEDLQAPAPIANRLSSMTLANGVYLFSLWGASSPYSLRMGKSDPTGLLALRILKTRQYLGTIL